MAFSWWFWWIPEEKRLVRGEQLDKILKVCELPKRERGEKDYKVRKRIIHALLGVERKKKDTDFIVIDFVSKKG